MYEARYTTEHLVQIFSALCLLSEDAGASDPFNSLILLLQFGGWPRAALL